MPLFKRTITDDRGTEHEPINIRDLKRDADDQSSNRRELAKYLKSVIRVESRRAGSRPFTVIIMVTAIAVGMVVLFLTRGGPMQVPAFPFVFGAIVLVRWVTKRRIGQQLAATVLAEGFCGSCTYSLRSMGTEADGCVVCAECGSAWRKERITNPHWDRPVLVPPTGLAWWQRIIKQVPKQRDLLTPDDRGRFVRSLDSWLVLLPEDRRTQLGKPAVAAMSRRLRSNGRKGRWAVAGAIMLAGLASGVVLTLLLGPKAVPYVVGFAVIAPFFAVLEIVGSGFCRPAKCVPLLIAQGWCGSCGRDITTLHPASDGCVTCPSCSSSWRLAPPSKILREQSSPSA